MFMPLFVVLIFQWGINDAKRGGTVTISFPLVFNNVYIVIALDFGNHDRGNENSHAATTTNTNFTYYSGALWKAVWMAIGK